MTVPPANPAPAGEGWRVEIAMPFTRKGLPVGWLTLNRHLHRQVEARIAREWRLAAVQAFQVHRVPRDLGRIYVQEEVRTIIRNDKDPGNWEPTLKPCIDALTPGRTYASRRARKGWVHEPGWGVIPADDPAHRVSPRPIFGEPLGRNSRVRGMVVLHIYPLPPEVQP